MDVACDAPSSLEDIWGPYGDLVQKVWGPGEHRLAKQAAATCGEVVRHCTKARHQGLWGLSSPAPPKAWRQHVLKRKKKPSSQEERWAKSAFLQVFEQLDGHTMMLFGSLYWAAGEP